MSQKSKITKFILDKKFKSTVFNGYDPLEVDIFLDEIINKVEALEQEKQHLELENKQLEDEKNMYRNKIKYLEQNGYSQKK